MAIGFSECIGKGGDSTLQTSDSMTEERSLRFLGGESFGFCSYWLDEVHLLFPLLFPFLQQPSFALSIWICQCPWWDIESPHMMNDWKASASVPSCLIAADTVGWFCPYRGTNGDLFFLRCDDWKFDGLIVVLITFRNNVSIFPVLQLFVWSFLIVIHHDQISRFIYGEASGSRTRGNRGSNCYLNPRKVAKVKTSWFKQVTINRFLFKSTKHFPSVCFVSTVGRSKDSDFLW